MPVDFSDLKPRKRIKTGYDVVRRNVADSDESEAENNHGTKPIKVEIGQVIKDGMD